MTGQIDELFSQFEYNIPEDISIKTALELLQELQVRLSNGEYYDENKIAFDNSRDTELIYILKNVLWGILRTLYEDYIGLYSKAVENLKQHILSYETKAKEAGDYDDILDSVNAIIIHLECLQDEEKWRIFATDVNIGLMMDMLVNVIKGLNISFYHIVNTSSQEG